MAETLISPGVLARENDQSQVTQGPVTVGAAIIGPSIKGPVENPIVVTSYSQYVAIFGGSVTSGSQQYSYLNQIAANNYFRQGGTSLLVTRVTSGSFSSATSTELYNNVESGIVDRITSTSDLTLNSFNVSSSVSNGPSNEQRALGNGGTGTGLQLTASFATSESLSSITLQGGTGYAVGDEVTFTSQSLSSNLPNGTDFKVTLSAANIVSQTPFTLSTISEGAIMNNSGSEIAGGALTNGSSDNIRWEITNVNTSSGIFSLAVRRGDDKSNQKTILETFTNLSLDPKAPNYIESAIGNSYSEITTDPSTGETYLREFGNYTNKSNYIYVSAVNARTPDYFDNNGTAKAALTGSIPADGSGSFNGATGTLFSGQEAKFNGEISVTNIQGLAQTDYTESINLLSNKDEYRYNLITAPGLNNSDHGTAVGLLVSTVESRQDAIAVIDLNGYDTNVSTIVSDASGFDSSYAATYWPWLQTLNTTGQTVWVPASAMIPGVYAFTDKSSDAWFAPAGLTRGALGNVIKAERKLTSGNRDALYAANVNPIATFPGNGVVVFGQKTLQKRSSALDRVNVRRLLIELKNYISQVADNLVFEQNSIATRNSFLTQVNPYLEGIQQRQGLYAFKVVMDETNNTADVVDRNELVGQLYLQPTKTAEFILLDFNVLPTGATFPA